MSDASNCLFCRIVAGEIPAKTVYETERTLAFRDIDPKAPVHVLVIPKQHYQTVGELAEADPALAGEVAQTAAAVVRAEGITDSGYRLIFNAGPDGGQDVFHVHGHVVGGRSLGSMLST